MTTAAIQGVLPVIQLPYHDDYTIDYATLQREIEWVFDAGADGITLALVTEIFRLTDAERDELVVAAVKASHGRGPVIVSVGDESNEKVVRHSRAAESAGADALMAIPPALTICTDEEISGYFAAMVEATVLPLILQDASGFLGNSIAIETQAALYDRYPGRIMFKPEAHPIVEQVKALRDATRGAGSVFEGAGGRALVESFPHGISGTMPGADCVWALVALWRALHDGDAAKADAIHGPLYDLCSPLETVDAFIAVEKMLLVKQGIFQNTLMRGPVGSVPDSETQSTVLSAYDRLRAAV